MHFMWRDRMKYNESTIQSFLASVEINPAVKKGKNK